MESANERGLLSDHRGMMHDGAPPPPSGAGWHKKMEKKNPHLFLPGSKKPMPACVQEPVLYKTNDSTPISGYEEPPYSVLVPFNVPSK